MTTIKKLAATPLGIAAAVVTVALAVGSFLFVAVTDHQSFSRGHDALTGLEHHDGVNRIALVEAMFEEAWAETSQIPLPYFGWLDVSEPQTDWYRVQGSLNGGFKCRVYHLVDHRRPRSEACRTFDQRQRRQQRQEAEQERTTAIQERARARIADR